MKFFGILILLGVFFVHNASAQEMNNTLSVSPAAPAVKITRHANPTTGYSWTAKYDSHLLKLVSAQYMPHQDNRIGSGGKMIWIFRALPKAFQSSIKQTDIKLVYARPWNPQDNPRQDTVHIIFNHA